MNNSEDMEILDTRFAKLLLESMADGVFTLDSTGRISSWNPAMERISGYSTSEALGKTCQMMNFDKCLSKRCPTGVNECGIYRLGKVDHKRCDLKHKNGSRIPVLKSARLVKNDNGEILGVVETVTDLTELENTRKKAEEAALRLGELHRMGNIIGKSHAMQQVFQAIRAAAASDATILIGGASGTGKELAAGAIHYNSVRKAGPYITVNCSALPESLLESELFGHARGSFTGAVKDRAGRFEEADGGTIFLDEISEISPYIQVKLLRVLQEREIERVGESRKRKIDIRIIAATNRDLLSLVKSGEFRQDLYYRLKVFPIRIPSLVERKEDIIPLTEHFIAALNKRTGKKIQGISSSAMKLFMDYGWPGNVRELENALEHAFVLCNGPEINISDIPAELSKTEIDTVSPSRGTFGRKKLTRDTLLELLDICDWNKAEVGRRTGFSRTAIWKYMKKWDIPLKNPGESS